MTTTDISIVDLLISLLLLIIPFTLFYIYKIKLIKSSLISVFRMVLQLSLVALYLETIFRVNNLFINVLWVFVMILVSVITSIKRVALNWRLFILPLLISGVSTVFILDTFFLGFILKLNYVFDARYLIPISGMIIGNMLNHNIVGLDTYFSGLNVKSELYYFILTNTNKKKLALQPFVNEAIKRSLNPLVASMAVIGIISLPGMMTGQILGGSSPLIAIKYQIMIMIAIFVGSSLNLFLSITLSNFMIFDKFDNINKSFFLKI